MDMRFRQVHLDFHTSEQLEHIGERFDKKQFQQALKTGHVDSVTVFSKCQHGWSYHPTKVNQMHPHLQFDLLGEELKACREIGVNAPVYLCAGLDEKEAVRHPEWLVRNRDESCSWTGNFTGDAGVHLLCFNTGYLELLLDQIGEVMQNYSPDALFLDIASVHPCYCAACRNDMINKGKDPRDGQAAMEQAEEVFQKYAQRVRETVRRYSSTCEIFHNAGHLIRGRRDLAAYNTHLELESLPTGGWGYDHFPMSASYVANLGMDYLGMTGKFHTTWGEFGGFKHPNALRYETALCLALGAKCSVGDQLHPSGEMDMATYELLGKAYGEVEEKEPWCRDARNCYDIGILGDEAVNCRVSDKSVRSFADIGANRIMLEGHYLYRFIDLEVEFHSYKLLILPDTIRLDDKLAKRLADYLNGGGKLLMSGQSGLEKERECFALDFDTVYRGENPYKPDYMIPGFALSTGGSAHVMYERGYLIEPGPSAKVFAGRQNPYFNRDLLHYSSHQHTPNDDRVTLPAAVLDGNIAYIGWDIFTDYGKLGSLHHKETVRYAIDQLLGREKTLVTDLADRGITTLTKQPGESRYIQHLLFAHTTNRGTFTWEGRENPMEVIEDIVPLYGVNVSLNLPERVKSLYLAPQKTRLHFQREGERITYQVPKVDCHQMVVIDVEPM